METSKWFDRAFDFNFDGNRYASIYKRLQAAPDALRGMLAGVPDNTLVHQPGGKWSVKEHAGHLSVLEPLWRIRFQDIRESKPVLTPADLDNKATTEAGFNACTVASLLEKFVAERNTTLLLLDSMDVPHESGTSLHPRLQQPMRIMDLAYFVAEHDDHHIACMRAMIHPSDR